MTAPLHEIAKRHEVRPTQISEWKKELQSNMAAVFERKSDRATEQILAPEDFANRKTVLRDTGRRIQSLEIYRLKSIWEANKMVRDTGL